MENNIEAKITNLLRKEKENLKKHLLSYQQHFPWISLNEENSSYQKEFSVYGWIDRQEETYLLDNDEKLKERIKKEIPEFVQGLISGLRFQLTPKICQKECYDSSNLIIKSEIDFYKLDYNGLIILFKKVDLSRDKEWVCFLPIELFKLTEGKKEHFELKSNLLNIIPLPLGNSLKVIFTEVSSPLLTYCVDDLFCQENWQNMGQNRLFTVAKTLYKLEEVKGRLIAIAKARPIEIEPPRLGKCQTCKKPLPKEKAMGGKRVTFSDAWYYFCSRGCSLVHDYREAMEKGERREEYLKRNFEQEDLIKKAIKEFEEKKN